jgi:oligoendopeptidase F
MSMELLAMPHLVAPDGYYTLEEARVAWLEHLEDVLSSLVHIASVDAFQAWIYTHDAGADRDARDAKWLEIRSQFEAGVDWSDHASFWEAGYPGVMLTDTALYRYPHYHTARDTPDKLDYERLARLVIGLRSSLPLLSG